LLSYEPGKQCCILDTNSLLFLSQVEIGSISAIEWILQDFTMAIPKIVFDDGKLNIPDENDELRSLFFRKIQPTISYVSDYFVDNISKLTSHLEKKDQSNIDEGEKEALSLALELSRSHKQYVLLITDDLKAFGLLQKFVKDDQIGILINSFDLILFLASRHADQIPIASVPEAMKQLNYLWRNNSPDAPKYQEPDGLFLQYESLIPKLSLGFPNEK
jgi:hypothetical protein